jgi:alkanesulfonate monooxygenase SsuD/methylene tetrahydromethanopterin reductase-like flavin-dependent oxidoreductase (luciferase family)
MNVKIGVTLPQFAGDIPRLIDAVRRAEEAGLDSVWVFDHLWPLGNKQRPMLEGWSTLAFLAAHTQNISIGTLVTRSTLRHPAVLAKMAATVANIAPGRVTLAIGSGDAASREENESFGLPYYSGAARIDQLSSVVQVVRSYLRGEVVRRADEFVEITDLPAGPTSVAPPVWVGGRSRNARVVAGRYADGWNCWAASPDRFATEAEAVRAAADGREIELTWGGAFVLANDEAEARAKLGDRDPEKHVVGGPERVAEHIHTLAEAGASHVVATFQDAGTPGSYEILGDVRQLVAN